MTPAAFEAVVFSPIYEERKYQIDGLSPTELVRSIFAFHVYQHIWVATSIAKKTGQSLKDEYG